MLNAILFRCSSSDYSPNIHTEVASKETQKTTIIAQLRLGILCTSRELRYCHKYAKYQDEHQRKHHAEESEPEPEIKSKSHVICFSFCYATPRLLLLYFFFLLFLFLRIFSIFLLRFSLISASIFFVSAISSSVFI